MTSSKGSQGEKLAARFLKKKGYRIIEKNYSVKTGEIDLIARKREFICFVEVKYRIAPPYHPVEDVTAGKQKRIVSAAERYLLERRITKLQPRFDILTIQDDGKGNLDIDHFENAF